MPSKKKLTRRTFLAGSAAGIALASCGGSGEGGGASAQVSRSPKLQPKGRVVILGFDGAEPGIFAEMIDRGELPHFARLAEGGTFKKLRSTIPPQSPVAWTSFTTCKNPGGHNIYDFIRRNPRGPRGPIPAVGTGKIDHPKFGADGSVSTPSKGVSYRKGDAFWWVADQQGLKSKVFNVPFAFPAEDLDNGIQLCGLGVPDLRGTTSMSLSLSDAFTPNQLEAGLSGHMRVALNFDGSDTAQVRFSGPRHTSYKYRDPKAYTSVPMTISVDRKSGRGVAKIGDQKIDLKQGAWSEWVETAFPMTSKYTAYGVSRFFPIEIGEHVRIYMTCQQFSPAHPYVPYTDPDEYARRLYERYGLHKTIGWAFDTHALRQDGLDEDAFLMDARETMAWREKLTLDELDRGDYDLLISAWTATDRIGHMFWRYRDPGHPMHDPVLAKKFGKALEESYRIADRIVGNVVAKLGPDDLFMVLSDHGFESFRRGFDVNSWLEEHGYLTVSNRKLARGGFLYGIDWANTKAYSVGLSSLYLNLSGRERYGIVAQSAADKVLAQLKDELLTVTDPEIGSRVFSNIYTRHDYHGVAIADAPDISFGYDHRHQSSKSAAKGAVGTQLCEDNMDKWSGDHASSDVARLPGILFSNRKIEADDPNILDLGVTALGYLGADVPSDFEGRDLLA